MAKTLQYAVTKGGNDCEALADFADLMASGSEFDNQFVRNFGVLTPHSLATKIPGAGITSYDQPVALNTGQASGFTADYQNTLPDGRPGDPSWNGDQAHHFAAFFQFGYLHGATAGEYASSVLEYFQGLDSGVMNLGDVRLGEVAAQIGGDLRSGAINRNQVGDRIRKLCN